MGNCIVFWAALPACGMAAALVFCGVVGTPASADESNDKEDKLIIGATATITETSSGIPFEARIDTGAKSCALHVEKVEIPNPETRPHRGKMARFLIKNHKGESAWLEKKIVAVVRVKSSSLKDGKYDRRFKVRLNLKWKNFEKEVTVSLDDRTDMTYPLLIGRNFLRGDFLVDVSKGKPDVKKVVIAKE
jgi:hypothetical protein